jgi:hypothetical protein
MFRRIGFTEGKGCGRLIEKVVALLDQILTKGLLPVEDVLGNQFQSDMLQHLLTLLEEDQIVGRDNDFYFHVGALLSSQLR